MMLFTVTQMFPLNILIVHNNYPAQFRYLAPYLSTLGHDVRFLARNIEWNAPKPASFLLYRYHLAHSSATPAHPYLHRFEQAIFEGQSALRSAKSLLDSGWLPDIIITHVGFGSGLFLHHLFPNAKKVGFLEWYYNASNSDVDFFPPHSVSINHHCQLQIWNSYILSEIYSCDQLVVPTQWQKQQFPVDIQNKVNVIHEGIDFDGISVLKKSTRSRLSFFLMVI